MKPADAQEQLIADLRQQVEALEKIVHRRSDELRLIQKLACPKDRLMIGSILDGNSLGETQLAPIDKYYSMNWHVESTHFVPSSVEETLEEIWDSAPRRLTEDQVGS